ncbi:MAG: hypothetical protein ACJA0H_001613 [Francisellaceae bacterium]|jgi:hypothetical protein
MRLIQFAAKKALLLPMIMAMSSVLWGFTPNDPTLRPGSYNPDQIKELTREKYYLNMIIKNHNESLVFINKQKYRLNDKIDNGKITAISESCVIILALNVSQEVCIESDNGPQAKIILLNKDKIE